MAITLVTSPTSPVISTRPIIYTCTSNAANLVRLEARIKIDSVNYVTYDVGADSGGTFTIDASQVVQDALAVKAKANNYNLRALAASTVATATGMSCSLVIDLFEVTGTAAPYTDTYPATPDLTTTAVYCINAVRDNHETQSLSDYVASTSSKKFLTKAPLTKSIRTDESEVLNIFIASTANANKLSVTRYNSAGATIATTTFATSGLSNNTVISVPVGVANINAMAGSIIDSSTYSYSVKLTTSADVATTETRTFVIDRSTHYVTKRIHFQNLLGAIDSYTFTGNYFKKTNTEYSGYNTYLPYSFTQYDRSTRYLNAVSTTSYILQSDFLKQSEMNWLAEIKRSVLWSLQEDSMYKAIALKPGEIDVEDVNNPLPVVKVEYVFANPEINIRG